MSKKTYTVTLGGFSAIESSSPYNAASKIAKLIENEYNVDEMVYEVIEEKSNKKYLVDLNKEKRVSTKLYYDTIDVAKVLIQRALKAPLDDVAINEFQKFLQEY